MVAYRNLLIRSPRRIRVTFSSALASGAFSPSWFTVSSLDGAGADPDVVVALAIDGAPEQVELALSTDLAPGGRYELAIAAGVPGADATTGLAAAEGFQTGAPPRAPAASFTASDLMNRLFLVDLLHEGGRFVETPDGDLATVGGPPNVKAAIERRVVSGPLPHRPDYGGNARKFVDAPAPILTMLRGQLERQARRDRRVVAASIEITEDRNDGDAQLLGTLKLIGDIPVRVSPNLRGGS